MSAAAPAASGNGSGVGSPLWTRARQVLATYRSGRSQGAQEWLKHAHEAHAFARSTFPEERRAGALKGFVERYCVGQSSRTIAVHAVALRLFGEQRTRERFGAFGGCLEAAALACGTTAEELPRPVEAFDSTPRNALGQPLSR